MRPHRLLPFAALAAACAQPETGIVPSRPTAPPAAAPASAPTPAEPRYLDVGPSAPMHRMQWMHQRQADDQGRVLPGVRSAALAQRAASMAATAMLDDAGVTPNDWTECGPTNIGGRTRALWIDPTNTNRMIGGSCGGGLWLSTNRGASWNPIADRMGNLNVSCIAQAPSDANILFAGTGEGYIDYAVGPGEGIWKSTNRGATWTQLASTAAFAYTNRIAVHPTNPQIVLAACADALRRSTDGGATWTVVRATRTLQVGFSPHDGNRASCATATTVGNAFLVSLDAGATWNWPAAGISDPNGRLEFAYSASTPGRMTLVRELGGAGNATAYWSSDHGDTWQPSTMGTLAGNQWWYDNAVWIAPDSWSHWVIGGVSIFQTINPTATPSNVLTISNGGANLNTPHSDVHSFTHQPGWVNFNDTFYACTDGGVYRAEVLATATATQGWERLDHQYRTTQFYSVAGHANGRVTGGTQDNGWLTIQPGQTAAVQTAGGDGGFVSIDPTDPNHQYGEYQWMTVTRSSDGGQTSRVIGPFHSTLTGVPSNERSAFIAPVVMSPVFPETLFAGGYRLYRTIDSKAATPTWDMICDRRSSGGYFQPITAIGVSSINPALAYVGYNDGAVFVSSNARDPSPTWTSIHAALPDRFCHRLVADHTVLGRAYAALGGYTPNNVWRFDSATSTWTNISGAGATALPAAPVYGLAQHPNDPDLLYAATEVGLFASGDGGQTWSTSNQGPSDSPVYDVQFVPNTTTMVLGTYGRGIWKADVYGARTTSFGAGCAGSAGVPSLSATPPRLGTTCTLTASNLPAGAAGWIGQGYSTTTWFGNPLPFELVPFGAPTCWLRVSLDFLRDAPSSAGGTFTTGVPIANDPALLETRLRFQYFAADRTANQLGTTVSNGLELRIGY